VLGAWSFFMPDPPRGQADLAGAPARTAEWKDYVILLHTPSYVLCTIGMAAMTFAMGGMGFWMPYYLEQRPGAPAYADAVFYFGAITAVAGLASTLLGGLAGDALRKYFGGAYFLVSGVAMLVGFPLFLAVLHAGFPSMWVLIFLALFCLFFNTGPTNTILANVTHPSMRATAFALNILFIHTFGDVASPVVVGLLTDSFHGDMNKSFLAVGLMFLVSGICWLVGIGFLERDTRLAPRRLAARVGQDCHSRSS
jgi:MFS family permease